MLISLLIASAARSEESILLVEKLNQINQEINISLPSARMCETVDQTDSYKKSEFFRRIKESEYFSLFIGEKHLNRKKYNQEQYLYLLNQLSNHDIKIDCIFLEKPDYLQLAFDQYHKGSPYSVFLEKVDEYLDLSGLKKVGRTKSEYIPSDLIEFAKNNGINVIFSDITKLKDTKEKERKEYNDLVDNKEWEKLKAFTESKLLERDEHMHHHILRMGNECKKFVFINGASHLYNENGLLSIFLEKRSSHTIFKLRSAKGALKKDINGEESIHFYDAILQDKSLYFPN